MTTTLHDSGYKKLFSNHTIFRQLVETFIHEEWVKEVDFTQAETLDKSFISNHYKETESDLIYKVTFKGREAYLIILLEFQSSVDRFMALRVLNYMTNFYMDYVQSTDKAKMLPPVFPIVLYNGKEGWTAPETIEALILDAPLLEQYAPRFRYVKIAEREYPPEVLLNVHNIVSLLFLAESEFDRGKLREELKSVFRQEQDRRAVSLLYNWFVQLWRHGRIPSEELDGYKEEYENAEEADTMLIETITQEKNQVRAEGELIGSIRTLQRVLGRPIRSEQELIGQDPDVLQAMLDELNRALGETVNPS